MATIDIDFDTKMDSPSPQLLPTHIQMLSLHSYYQSDEGVDIYSGFGDGVSTPTTDTIRYFMESTTSIDMIDGNPKHWEWRQVKMWFKKIKLDSMIKIFVEHKYNGINGETLLNMNINRLFTIYDAGSYGNPLFTEENDRRITKFFKELTKLILRANKNESLNQNVTINDFMEMKRRINLFIDKWDRILWIEYYVNTNNVKPTAEIFSEEWGLTKSIATIYLDYYENKERIKQKDLYDLFQDFDVYSDCILWWYIIISILKTNSSRSLWLIFERVAEITNDNIAIKLLEKFQFDLTRFDHTKLDKIAQHIVIGSQFPICAALRIAKWLYDRALYDVARSDLWKEVAETYVESAIHYLELVESDHLATVLLEVKSDIDGLSALDMALKYKLQSFVSNNRIERITTSMMNIFEFLQPENYSDAFEITALSVKLIWKNMKKKEFYFTPLGSYLTTVSLYIIYLIFFSYWSTQQFSVYGPMTRTEIIFWCFNLGYVMHEIQNFILNGLDFYYSQTQNFFDTIISIVFLCCIVIRIYALYIGPGGYKFCQGVSDPVHSDCWQDSPVNTTFSILYSIATIVLWIGVVNFCVLSQRLGTMVSMIFRMLKDIVTFFIIMLIVFFGFTFGLMFLMGEIHTDFKNPIDSGITLFRAMLDDFDFTSFTERSGEDQVNDAKILFGYFIMFVYLIIGSLVLLNLLIAMMAKTFSDIKRDNVKYIIFSRFELAVTLNNNPAFISAPLNLLAMILVILFYTIEVPIRFILWVINYCSKLCDSGGKKLRFDLLLYIMPKFMKKRAYPLDDQILFSNCGRTWTVLTNEGETECEIIKYKPSINKHYAQFEREVSINNSVEKKKQWLIDILELNEKGLIDLQQFTDETYIDKDWSYKLYESVKKYGANESPYWICAYCKQFVKESKVAVKMLGWKLKVRDIEMKIINRHSPLMCPNCYRNRLERARIALIWEIFSFWTYNIIMLPFLISFIGIMRMLKRIMHPNEMRQGLVQLRKKLCSREASNDQYNNQTQWEKGEELEIQDISSKDWKKAKVVSSKTGKICVRIIERETDKQDMTMSMLSLMHTTDEDNQDIELDLNKDKDRIREIINPEVCNYHYRDWHLIKAVRDLDDEHAELFAIDEKHEIWRSLYGAKHSIEPYVLQETISDHILALSKEHEIMPSDFHNDYIGIDEIIKECGSNVWESYLKPIATTLFSEIQMLAHSKVPLHLLARYPFDVSLVLDDLETYLSAERPELVSTEKIIDALRDLKFLNCKDHDERALIVYIINQKKDFYQTSKGDKSGNQLYHKFLVYLHQIQSLFQDTRKIKNMMRDVSTAIVESGVSSSVFLDQVYFLFEDVRNYVESIPFFRSMRTEQFGNETKIELWTIRNSLWVLYFLQHTVKHHIIAKHPKIYVTKDEILNMVLEAFKYDIIDPDAITDIIQHEVNEDITTTQEEKKYDNINLDDIEIDTLKTQQSQIEIMEQKSKECYTKRIDLFQKKQITAKDVQKELFSIFCKIQNRRQNRITDSSIAHYRRHLDCKLLQNDECLKFIFEQLCRYCTFYGNKMKTKVESNEFYKILCCIKFENDGYFIDKEMKPKLIDKENTQILYGHLLEIFEKANNKKTKMRLTDILSIITLYYKVFSNLTRNLHNINDRFVVSHDVFCKFMDDQFDIDSNREHWSVKTRLSSDLFQSVLDSSKSYVTLGQIKQTTNKLIYDIKNMECGGIIRLLNHLNKLQNQSLTNCKLLRYEWKNKNKVSDLQYITDNSDLDSFQDIIEKMFTFGINDPGLKFDHMTQENWSAFITQKANSYHRKHIILDTKEEKEFEVNIEITDLIQERTDIEMHQILNEVLNEPVDELKENFPSVISPQISQLRDDFEGILRTSDFGILKERKKGELKRNKTQKQLKKLEQIKGEVFSTILSFNSKRITFQQWFEFALAFCQFLGRNKAIKTLMKKYLLIWNENDANEVNRVKKELKNSSFNDKRRMYFGDLELKEFELEINWLFEGTENLYELTHRIYPFWSSRILKEIYYFVESTDQIQGIYELKATEYTQLKYSLHVNNNELVNKLFNIIRFKMRSLSYKQIYDYFNFLLTIKYKIDKAILNSTRAEDTTVSKNGLKNILNISLNDESEWLFQKVKQLYGSKITWKQINAYLSKTIRVRDDVRDFFNDAQRDKNYKKKRAEIIYSIDSKQIQIKNQLKKLNHQNNNDNIDEIQNRIIKYSTINSNKIDFDGFKSFINDSQIDIKTNYLKNIFKHLLSKQQINNYNVNKDELDIGFLIDFLKMNVHNYQHLTSKQILKVALSELILTTSTTDNSKVYQSMDSTHTNDNKGILNEIMKQNKLMMEEMQNKYEAKLALQMENFRREINELP